jgi:hypothetical protein
MLKASEFLKKMRTEREMLARGECPEGWAKCAECKTPRPSHRISHDGVCNECYRQRAEAAMGDELERHPILPPWARSSR